MSAHLNGGSRAPATLIECDDDGPLAGRVAYMAQAELNGKRRTEARRGPAMP